MIMNLFVALAIFGMTAGFKPLSYRSSVRSSRLSMAFELPSFDGVLQKLGSLNAATELSAAVPTEAVPAAKQIIAASVEQASSLSGGEFVIGLGLGLVPYLLIPVLALSAVKGLVKPARPLPVPVEPTTTVGAYTKSLREGLNEGVKELFSVQNAETDLTKKGIKLSAAGFGSAIVLTAVLFATTKAAEESKVVSKPITPAAIVKIVAPAAPAAAIVAPTAVPAVAVAPLPVTAAPVVGVDKAVAEKAASDKAVAEKAASDKAASDKAVAEKAASDKAASDKAVAEKAASDKATSDKAVAEKAASDKAVAEKAASDKAVAEKAASDKAVAEKAASDKAVAEKAASDKAVAEKAASDKAVAEKAASVKVVEKAPVAVVTAPVSVATPVAVAVPVAVVTPAVETAVSSEFTQRAAKGMEPEKVDFAALKLLRVIQSHPLLLIMLYIKWH